MLDIKDINNLDVDILLSSYEGKNPYIKYMKKKLETENKYFLTNSQSNYIKNYFTFEPKVINKVIELTNYFSEQLKYRPLQANIFSRRTNRLPAIRTERIYGAGDGAFLASVDIKNMTHKTIRFPIVPNHLEGVSGNPL